LSGRELSRQKEGGRKDTQERARGRKEKRRAHAAIVTLTPSGGQAYIHVRYLQYRRRSRCYIRIEGYVSRGCGCVYCIEAMRAGEERIGARLFQVWYVRSECSPEEILPCPPFYWTCFYPTSGRPCEEYPREKVGRPGTQLDTQISHNHSQESVHVFDGSVARHLRALRAHTASDVPALIVCCNIDDTHRPGISFRI
jgi:hypothetical protein